MEIRPILLSLKHNKFLSGVIVLQAALAFLALYVSTSDTYFTLKDWNKASGLPLEEVISVRSRAYGDIDVKSMIDLDVEKLKSLPGVLAVTPNRGRPTEAPRGSSLYLSPSEDAQSELANIFEMNASALSVLKLTLLEGRDFAPADVYRGPTDEGGAAVVMISEAMSKALFGNESAIGKSLYLEKGGAPVYVIGVYSNFINGGQLNRLGKSYNTVIRPQVTWKEGSTPDYLVRVEPNTSEQIKERIVDVLYKNNSNNRYVSNVETLTRVLKRMYDGRSSDAAVLLGVSLLLIFVASLGTTGLVAFLISQRRKQIGIRRALGATNKMVIRYFLLENSILVFIGLGIGLLLIFTQFILSAQATGDLNISFPIMLTCALFTWLVNVFAVYLPARKVVNISPAIATRG
ncbi:ABC transporter permease [Pseudoalteromonas sp. T1lg65]|uniref:ABC transporter permease n=1 Tax=Pseudoalteromonas sp. T1lg65 TaxID=2077101 RepID=UPI003F7AFC1F